MTTTGWLVLGGLACAVSVAGALGAVADRLGKGRGRLEGLLTADRDGALARVAYYNEVRDSHCG